MEFLKRLFGQRPEPIGAPAPDPRDVQADCAALADDPGRFAGWVCEYCLGADENDDEAFAPPADHCERLQITPEQRTSCIREHVILHAVGACMFVGRNLPPAYYSVFRRDVCASTAQRVYGVPTDGRIQEVTTAVDRYIELLTDGSSSTDFGMAFLERALPDNPHHLELLPVGIHAFELAVMAFTSVQDGYCQLKLGLSFDAAQALGLLGEREK